MTADPDVGAPAPVLDAASGALWTRAPLLIHVGLHKTGTTLLAEALFERPGQSDFAATSDRERIYAALLTPSSRRYDPSEARTTLAEVAERAVAGDRIAAILGENIAGRPFHARHHREVAAERLARTFPDARILITIREQSAIIQSMYGEFIRFGYTNSLTQFLARPPDGSSYTGILDYEFYDYAHLYEVYRRHFPEDRIILVPFEAMIRDPGILTERLGRAFDRKIAPPDPETWATPARPAWSTLANAVARHANRFRSRETPWLGGGRGPLSPNALAYRVDRLTPGWLRRREAAAQRAQVRAAVGNLYAPSNRAISDRLGLGLGALGYPVTPEGA